MRDTLRVVQVGAGSWGRSWAGVVASAPGIELVAIAEPFADARERVKTELDGWSGPIVASLDDALAQVDADAVLVITPPDSHYAVVTNALRAGKHVLVEKPLAMTIDEAEDLVVAADKAERTLMVSQNYRFRRPTRTAQKLIAGGALGDLISLKIYFQRDTRFLFEGDFRYVMRHPLILDMSIHHFDMIRAITGQDVRRIDARSWRIPDSKYVHDPAAAALIELESGVPIVYEGSWGTYVDETSWNGDWDIIGTKGRLTWTGGEAEGIPTKLTLTTWGKSPRLVEQVEVPFVDRAGTLEAFREAVQSGTEPETSARDNIHSLAIVLGCIESIERGEPVDVREMIDRARTPAKR